MCIRDSQRQRRLPLGRSLPAGLMQEAGVQLRDRVAAELEQGGEFYAEHFEPVPEDERHQEDRAGAGPPRHLGGLPPG
eukprot:7137723-Alexandrium_andersonii.AAC.1